MIGGHKVGGQGRWSRSGYRSWGQVGKGSRFGVQVGGKGHGSGQGLGVMVGVKVVVMVGSQGQGSMSGS